MLVVEIAGFIQLFEQIAFLIGRIGPVIDLEFDRANTQVQILNALQLLIEILFQIILAEFNEGGHGRGRDGREARIVIHGQFNLVVAAAPSVIENQDVGLLKVPGQRMGHLAGHSTHCLNGGQSHHNGGGISNHALWDIEVVVAVRPLNFDHGHSQYGVLLIVVLRNLIHLGVRVGVVGGNAHIGLADSVTLTNEIFGRVGIPNRKFLQSRMDEPPLDILVSDRLGQISDTHILLTDGDYFG